MKRFETFFNLLQPFKLLIDIGCDHGYCGLMLLQQKKVVTVWNVDINKGPLSAAHKHYQKKKITDYQAKFFLSNGFDNLPASTIEATVLIAGMGANKIVQILKQLPDNINQIILLPHTDAFLCRKWAVQQTWTPIYEEYCKENQQIYQIIVLVKDKHNYYQTDHELLIGKYELLSDKSIEYCSEYWNNIIKQIKKIPQEYQNTYLKWILKTLKCYPRIKWHI